MNIPELRLECLRLAIANYPQKSHLRQQEEAQHYLEWIMSPTVTIELPTPDNAPDINIDPEYNTHLQSFDTPERALRLNGWLNTNHPFVDLYEKEGMQCWWNGDKWCVRKSTDATSADRFLQTKFWDGKDPFPAWLAAEITKLQTPQEKEQEQEEPNPNPNLGPSPLISPEWRECETDGFMAMMLGDSYRICDMSSGCYPQHKENGMWTAVMDNGKFSHQSLITAQIACERHKARAQGSRVERHEQAIKPQEALAFLKSILPYSDDLKEEFSGEMIYFFWRGNKYRYDTTRNDFDRVPSHGLIGSNDTSILMTALVRQAVGKR